MASYFGVLRWIWNKLRIRRSTIEKLKANNTALRQELRRAHERLSGAENAVTGDGLWLARPVTPPRSYAASLHSSIPIITIANLKGGVGKTTLTAHLARFYAKQGKRVLAIDLDYQGSLSSLAAQGQEHISRVSQFVLGNRTGDVVSEIAWPMQNGPEEARLLTSTYELARVENQAMVHWLTRREERDTRYFLAEILHSKPVQDKYDIILIDAAPRITTGTIQALCASTHALIPTKLDTLSASAVAYFVSQLLSMKTLWPYLNIAGVVGTMTQHDIGRKTSTPYDLDALIDYEREALLQMQENIRSRYQAVSHPQPANLILPYTTFIPAKRAIARLSSGGAPAGRQVPAGARKLIEEIFERLGRELANRVSMEL